MLLMSVCGASFARTPTIMLATEHLPPYQIISSDLDVSGFATEIVLETMKRSQYSFKFNSYTWARSYNLAQQKANVCIYSIARIPARELLFKWIGKITEVNNAVFWGLKKDQHKLPYTIEQIKNFTTAVNLNDATHLGLLKHGFINGENLYVLNNTQSLIELLVSRPEINFIVADDITISYRAQLVGVDMNDLQRIFEIKDLPLDFHLACSNQTDDNIIAELTKSLKSIHQDGTYNAILTKWKSSMMNYTDKNHH